MRLVEACCVQLRHGAFWFGLAVGGRRAEVCSVPFGQVTAVKSGSVAVCLGRVRLGKAGCVKAGRG